MLKAIFSLLICASIMVTPALAGGGNGGAKKDGSIKVVHDLAAGTLTGLGAGNDSFIVIATPPAALVTKVNAGTATPQDITNAGGLIIKVGRSGILAVKSGNVRLYGAVVNRDGNAVPVTVVTVPVAKGKTTTVNASAAPVAVGAPWPAP
jgi:hypothetical protein